MACMTSVLSDIKALVKGFNNEELQTAWSVLTSCIIQVRNVLQWLTKVDLKNNNVWRQIRSVTRGLKGVYRGLLVQCLQLKNYSDQCKTILCCLECEILSQHMHLDVYLWSHRLEAYTPLFETWDIEYVSEIVDMEITHEVEMHFKEPMTQRDFETLMQMLDKAEHDRYYIRHCMETDLKLLGKNCSDSAEIVSWQLRTSLTDTEEITQKVAQDLEAQKSATAAVGVGFKVLSTAGLIAITGGLATLTIPGLAVAGVGSLVSGAGIIGAAKSKSEEDKISTQLNTIDTIMSTWEDVLKSSVLKWEYLILKIRELVKLLMDGRGKLEEDELHDMHTYIHDTEKSLRKFQRQADNFEIEINYILMI
ncbi:uncharacterized protein LOC144437808 [Glandiceps talaboti]